ncbi:adenosine deaminase family protein [Klebsiella spallanzanii]|uniref:adenosine deaminase family protein n=1 Tax=Klebsiella spallanzanii TaxID=2587528 RepID=UPI00116798E4|nr:hypothetical protein [Klebsiella spallanzanii]VUS77803.1 Aminodeoxyfutalosine deaminase [Klebsiella spallanzanii]
MLSIPKVILHEHLEGSVTANLAVHLSRKNGIAISDEYIRRCTVPGDYEYAWDKSDFAHFIKIYDFISSLIKVPEDYYLVTADFISRNARAGMIYCELLISPEHMMKVGCGDNVSNYRACLHEVTKAIKDAENQVGTIVRLHAVLIRHDGVERVSPVVDILLNNPDPYITGVNVAGHEGIYRFSDYSPYLNQLYQHGLRGSLHAGEICGAESVKEALGAGASRIGHGIRSIECPELIAELVEKEVLLEVSLTSNHLLINDIRQGNCIHPIRALYDSGVKLNLNTDDAGICSTDILKEYQFAMSSFDFRRAELIDISMMAIEAAFVAEDIKNTLLDKVCLVATDEDINFFAKGGASSPALHSRFAKRYKKLTSFRQ